MFKCEMGLHDQVFHAKSSINMIHISKNEQLKENQMTVTESDGRLHHRRHQTRHRSPTENAALVASSLATSLAIMA